MKVNEQTAVIASNVMLVPYEHKHVKPYHIWMEDEELRNLTRSDRLCLQEEYEMQESWREDPDKLTFIVCLPPSIQNKVGEHLLAIRRAYQDEHPEIFDSPTSAYLDIRTFADYAIPSRGDRADRMIGDVNIYFTQSSEQDPADTPEGFIPTPEDPIRIVGEIEVMIARKELHGLGYGRSALGAFLWYLVTNMNTIVREFAKTSDLCGKVDIPFFPREPLKTLVDRTIERREALGRLGVNVDTDLPSTRQLSRAVNLVEPPPPAGSSSTSTPPPVSPVKIDYLRVMIDKNNKSSLSLFKSFGFERISERANYFDEYELRWSPLSGFGMNGNEGLLEHPEAHSLLAMWSVPGLWERESIDSDFETDLQPWMETSEVDQMPQMFLYAPVSGPPSDEELVASAARAARRREEEELEQELQEEHWKMRLQRERDERLQQEERRQQELRQQEQRRQQGQDRQRQQSLQHQQSLQQQRNPQQQPSPQQQGTQQSGAQANAPQETVGGAETPAN